MDLVPQHLVKQGLMLRSLEQEAAFVRSARASAPNARSNESGLSAAAMVDLEDGQKKKKKKETHLSYENQNPTN